MNINITISDSTESQSIQLLTKVVECLQSEKTELNKKFLTLNSKKKIIENQLAEQAEKCQLLETEKKDFERKLIGQEEIYQKLKATNKKLENELTEQQGKYQTLEAEKKALENKLTEQENICQKLEAANKDLEKELTEQQGKYQTLEAEKKNLENKLTKQEENCQKLESEKVSVEKSYAELQKQQDEAKTRRLIESIKHLSQMLQYSLGTSLSPKWSEFLGGIKNDIDKFITEEKTIGDITLKIVSKNGWLAKLTSIRWWSVAASVKNDLPISLQEGSGFFLAYCNLQYLLKENGVDILIPTCDFSSDIESYKADYDEETIVKDLFPEYVPQGYVLCEINYVSYNGNVGKCISFES